MKKLLVLFVAISLILGSLQQQADARMLANEDKRKLVTEHQLASQPSNLVRKANHNDAKDATASAKTDSSDSNDDDDDTNQSYGKYGNANGSTPGSHHYFPKDQNPSKN